MQLNDRYRGGWTFGEREWVKEPGSNKRVPRTRRSGPLVTQERPELALADECTWAAVQQRFASRPTTPKAHRSYMLSSLMHCALCGGRMQNTGGSTTRRYFGCANAQKRGGSVCTNRRNIPMAPLEDVVLGTITAKLGACMGEVRELVDERIKTWAAGRDGGKVELRQQIADTARQLANLVEVAAATGSPAVAQKIREVEARRSRLLAELAEASAPTVELPSIDELTSRVLALGSLRDAPPEVAREQLRAIIEDGRIYCQPNLDGSFAVRWGVLPLSLVEAGGSAREREMVKSENRRGLVVPGRLFVLGCGGWI